MRGRIARNGYHEPLRETRAGSIPPEIPKLRSCGYFPPSLEPRRTAKKALAAVIQEAYVQGVSTRSVDELVKAMGMSGISKSQVLRLWAEIYERVGAFLDRPLEGNWPYLWIDATYVKVREAGRIASKAVIIVIGNPIILREQNNKKATRPCLASLKRVICRNRIILPGAERYPLTRAYMPTCHGHIANG